MVSDVVKPQILKGNTPPPLLLPPHLPHPQRGRGWRGKVDRGGVVSGQCKYIFIFLTKLIYLILRCIEILLPSLPRPQKKEVGSEASTPSPKGIPKGSQRGMSGGERKDTLI